MASSSIIPGIEFVNYTPEFDLDDVMRLVGQDLSEPYSSKNYFCFVPILSSLPWPTTCTIFMCFAMFIPSYTYMLFLPFLLPVNYCYLPHSLPHSFHVSVFPTSVATALYPRHTN